MVPEEIVWGGRNAVFTNPESKLWLDRMAEKGWTCPTWPAEYGGGGLSSEEAKILAEELARINARIALTSFGISMLDQYCWNMALTSRKWSTFPK